MQKLNFPNYTFRFKNTKNKVSIFDVIRKKFIILTPEENVRQHTIHFLLANNYPLSYINVEKEILLNGTKKRYDIIVYKSDGSVFLLVECKAPEITISQSTFDQIARYNLELKSQYLMITNGLNHYFCYMDNQQQNYVFLEDIPNYVSPLK